MAVDHMLDRSLQIQLQVTNVDRTPKTRKVGNSSFVSNFNEANLVTNGETSCLGTRNSIVLRRNAAKTSQGNYEKNYTQEDLRDRLHIKRG